MNEEAGASSRKSEVKRRNLPHRVGKVARDGGFETHFVTGAWMAKGELPGVQHLARVIAGAFAAVELVAQDGMAEVMEMHPDLVGPAAVQGAFDETDLVAGTKNAIFGFRGAALAARDAHPLAMDGMPRDGFVDDARSLAQDSGDEREINFRHCSRGELAGEIAVSRVVFRDDESAAGFLVQTMNDSGPFLSSDAGKIVAVREECVYQGMGLMSRARVHDDAGRLVEDEEIVVLEKDVEVYLFRLRFDLLEFWFPQLHDVAGADQIAWPGSFAIEADESFADQRLKPGARKGGERFRQNAVEALARLFAGDSELDHGQTARLRRADEETTLVQFGEKR